MKWELLPGTISESKMPTQIQRRSKTIYTLSSSNWIGTYNFPATNCFTHQTDVPASDSQASVTDPVEVKKNTDEVGRWALVNENAIALTHNNNDMDEKGSSDASSVFNRKHAANLLGGTVSRYEFKRVALCLVCTDKHTHPLLLRSFL